MCYEKKYKQSFLLVGYTILYISAQKIYDVMHL